MSLHIHVLACVRDELICNNYINSEDGQSTNKFFRLQKNAKNTTFLVGEIGFWTIMVPEPQALEMIVKLIPAVQLASRWTTEPQCYIAILPVNANGSSCSNYSQVDPSAG